MLVGRFIRQLVFASIAVAVVASNQAGIGPGIWVYSCTAERGLIWYRNELNVLGIVFSRVCQ